MVELANSREYTDTEIINDTETELKLLIKRTVFNVNSMINFRREVKRIVDKNLKEVRNEDLREVARKSLYKFAEREYLKLVNLLNLGNMPIILSFYAYNNIETKPLQVELTKQIQTLGKAKFNEAFSQLGDSNAIIQNGHSLYAHSELVARYEKQQNMLADLKSKTKLVICDTHSDCSDRCFRWQGKIYSLDGTYGRTKDGRSYQPLENAVNVIDKYGYKNGLLGFNCRHKLKPFREGMKAVKVTREEQRKQNKLTITQRALEREVRYAKDLAYTFDGIDKDKFEYYRAKSRMLTRKYRKFCEENNRVEYRSRLKI